MRDYLEEATRVLGAPRPLSELLRENRRGVVNVLIKNLSSPNSYARKYAAFALGQIGETGVVDILRSAYGAEPGGGTKEAMGASIIALLSVPPGASEHIRAAAVKNVYDGRQWNDGLEEALKADQMSRASDYQQRGLTELESAPLIFKTAFLLLSDEPEPDAAKALFECATEGGEGMTDAWRATAFCCAAYCFSELGSYEEAIPLARMGMKLGFLECGAYYYYSALWNALNQLDRLPEAADVADEAIEFFSGHGSPSDVCMNLGRKANVLKQLASHLSRSSDPRARVVIVDAIKALCDSLAITTVGWEESCPEELEAMATIARRVSVSRRDLTFLDSMPSVSSLVSQFFQ